MARRQARGVEADAWAAHAAWLDEQRVAAEAEAWLSHYQWLEDERRRCEKTAWAEHQAWLDEHKLPRRAASRPSARPWSTRPGRTTRPG